MHIGFSETDTEKRRRRLSIGVIARGENSIKIDFKFDLKFDLKFDIKLDFKFDLGIDLKNP